MAIDHITLLDAQLASFVGKHKESAGNDKHYRAHDRLDDIFLHGSLFKLLVSEVIQ